MKATIVLLSILFASSSVLASTNNELCDKGTSQSECKAYISGLVEGYIASKQNYLPKRPEFESEYVARAFANRVGKSHHNTLNNKQPACLPSVVDKDKIVAHLMTSPSDTNLTEQLGDYLRTNFSCDNKLAKK